MHGLILVVLWMDVMDGDECVVTSESSDEQLFVCSPTLLACMQMWWHALHLDLQQLDQAFLELTGCMRQLMQAVYS
jgi:hypothetical protein